MRRSRGRAALLAAACACGVPGTALAAAGEAPALAERRELGEVSLNELAAKWLMQQSDPAQLAFYRSANADLLASPDPRTRIVLMGDSITYHWETPLLPEIAGTALVNRGIPGQNSSQMLLRFEDDVVALSPRTVVIMAGTNDLRIYDGTVAMMREPIVAALLRNVTAMADIAQGRGIGVVLCAIPPIGANQAGDVRDPETLALANARLRALAEARGYPFVDYGAVLSGPDGMLDMYLTADGLHPLAAGYRRMRPLLESVLAGG